MVAKEQTGSRPEGNDRAGGRRKPWAKPRVITATIDDDTEGGVAALPEAENGVLS